MERIEAEGARMGLLVEDLLLLARLDQQRPLTFAPVDLAAIAGDAVHDARAVQPDRPIALHLDESLTDVPVVLGDEGRLRQVVGNLVTNALTHTPATTRVTVTVGRGRRRPGRRSCCRSPTRARAWTPADADAGLRALLPGRRLPHPRAPAAPGSGLAIVVLAGGRARRLGRTWTPPRAGAPTSPSGCPAPAGRRRRRSDGGAEDRSERVLSRSAR